MKEMSSCLSIIYLYVVSVLQWVPRDLREFCSEQTQLNCDVSHGNKVLNFMH